MKLPWWDLFEINTTTFCINCGRQSYTSTLTMIFHSYLINKKEANTQGFLWYQAWTVIRKKKSWILHTFHKDNKIIRLQTLPSGVRWRTCEWRKLTVWPTQRGWWLIKLTTSVNPNLSFCIWVTFWHLL